MISPRPSDQKEKKSFFFFLIHKRVGHIISQNEGLENKDLSFHTFTSLTPEKYYLPSVTNENSKFQLDRNFLQHTKVLNFESVDKIE
jgi:hypothetical protein